MVAPYYPDETKEHTNCMICQPFFHAYLGVTEVMTGNCTSECYKDMFTNTRGVIVKISWETIVLTTAQALAIAFG